jgi:hypothetical protein
MPEAILPARYVRTITKAIYGQILYFRDWLKPQSFGLPAVWLPPLYGMYRIKPAKDYYFDGLAALSELFANETYECIQFQSISVFPQLAKYPEGCFAITDEACTFHDWEKGYLLALLKFGDTKAGSSSSSKILGKYSGDIEFMKRYVEKARRGQRDVVGVLKAFAWVWDAFFLPLRYFGAQSALEFSREYLGYFGKDLSTFRRVFFNGGSSKDKDGLRLNPQKPFILRKWSQNLIILSSQAAAHHGLDAQLMASGLEEVFQRRVDSR